MMSLIASARFLSLALACFGLLLNSPCFAGQTRLQHHIDVSLNPEAGTLSVEDRIVIEGTTTELAFRLHGGLAPRSMTAGVVLHTLGTDPQDASLELYRVSLPTGQAEFMLRYGGRIAHEFSERGESPGRRQRLVNGTISSDGVFLSQAVAWFPVVDDAQVVFDMTVTLPDGWSAVSQGAGPDIQWQQGRQAVTWRARQPQDDIYLVAGRYKVYRERRGDLEAQVFLRSEDAELARRYLDVTFDYVSMYSALIGAYPYPKFALVENFWETGYGMPSFTLLGPRVIRLPFILHTSYPHEILHNWWGNSVYLDYQRGNWAEGLTAYLADHLVKEQRGQGSAHRRNSLQRFAGFVRDDNDFPLVEFRSRHSGSSQAVGYDKSMMLFHMLRRKLGDAGFIEGLRRFYSARRFSQASFADLQTAFEQASGLELEAFFSQWTGRVGSPALAIRQARSVPRQGGYRVELSLDQTQVARPFELDVPVVVYFENGAEPLQRRLVMNQRSQAFTIDTLEQPAAVAIDPRLDLFRQLHVSESPPVLSDLFGSRRALFVLPADAPAALLEAYRALAGQWAEGYAESAIVVDGDLDEIPADSQAWLLGWENRWAESLRQGLTANQAVVEDRRVILAGEAVARPGNSFVLTHRHAEGGITAWLGSDNVAAVAGLARKLPHYGRYSYLAFAGDHPTISRKGQWPVTDSALIRRFGDDNAAVLPPLPDSPLWPRPGR